jgi:hypothetical protein
VVVISCIDPGDHTPFQFQAIQKGLFQQRCSVKKRCPANQKTKPFKTSVGFVNADVDYGLCCLGFCRT